KCGTLLEHDFNHFLSCKLLRRTIITTRHDLIVRTLASFIRQAGGAVFVEPKFMGSLRPDAQVHFPANTINFDVSVTHPSAPSYALQGSKSPLAVATRRENAKNTKYLNQAKEEKASFTPFVMETFGGFGKMATGFIKRISQF